MRRALLSAAAVALGLCALPAHATVRPEPLEPKPGCEKWHGQSGGNDPTVELDMQICPAGKGVSGETQWSSLRSGWSVRAIEGIWSADEQVLTLHDMGFNQSKPNPGWRFCLIDHYDLKRVGSDALEGTYRSDACNDSAWIKLKRIATLPAPPSGSGPQPGSSGAAEPRPVAPEPRDSASPSVHDRPGDAAPPAEAPTDAPKGKGKGKGCGACSTELGAESGLPAPSAWLAATLLLGALGRPRRRRLSRAGSAAPRAGSLSRR